MARAASLLSPTTRIVRPIRVARNIQASATASTQPARNRTLTLSAAWTCGLSLHQPKGIAGKSGATGWIYGLPKKNARPIPSSIIAMPVAMSLTLGSRQTTPWTAPNRVPASADAPTPSHADPVSYAAP